MSVEFRLCKMDTVAGYTGTCSVCGKECSEWFYQSAHEKDCVGTFRGSDYGHKRCLMNRRKNYKL